MLEMSNAHVARMTKQPSDFSCVVTMVYVKSPFATWLCGFANGALSVLFGEQRVIFYKRKSVMFFQLVTFEAARIDAISFAVAFVAKLARQFQIVFSPFSVSDVAALAAVGAQFIKSGFARAKIFSRQDLLASRAFLDYASVGSRVRHVEAPFGLHANLETV